MLRRAEHWSETKVLIDFVWHQSQPLRMLILERPFRAVFFKLEVGIYYGSFDQSSGFQILYI